MDSDSKNDEEDRCDHDGVETEEDLVCCKYSLVLSSMYCPDVHWYKHPVLESQYMESDRLVAVDKNLMKLMEKAHSHRSLPLVVIKSNCAQ